MKNRVKYIIFLLGMVVVISAIIFLINTFAFSVGSFSESNRQAGIYPNYNQTVIPPNIAPLNFYIKEDGDAFVVKIYSENGASITIESSKPTIDINIGKWHKLLEQNKGNELVFDVLVKSADGKWTKYLPIKNRIAQEPIDNYLAYRLINTGYVLWMKLGIYQRNLQNFDETPIIENTSIDGACLNCHSFCRNDPKKMMLHIRMANAGTILIQDKSIKKIETKTDYTMSAGVYPAWHPNGKMIAYSVNKIGQNFYAIAGSRIEVSDNASDLVVYDIERNMVTTSPKISTPRRENLPTWSPDGKYLYFISAPEAKKDSFETRINTKYDLMRISFDAKTMTWGDVDTVLTATRAGQTISFPKISPDGKFLMFTMSDFGYFTIHHNNSDLYLMDLATKEYKRMEINSDKTESYHTWSNNNRWFVFSSKRMDGLFTRPYICYIDNDGKVSNPFPLPQKDPLFYDTFLKNYNVPELVKDKVGFSAQQIRDAIYRPAIPATFDPKVDIDALSGATKFVEK